jgi:hypothetical protein
MPLPKPKDFNFSLISKDAAPHSALEYGIEHQKTLCFAIFLETSCNTHKFPLEEALFERLLIMRLEDFRIEVTVLTRQELAAIADVSISSVQRAEEGKGVNRLTQARILKGLSQHLGRTVSKEEIDEFRDS